jgi:hypothetical protein
MNSIIVKNSTTMTVFFFFFSLLIMCLLMLCSKDCDPSYGMKNDTKSLTFLVLRFNVSSRVQQQQPSILVPSKLG